MAQDSNAQELKDISAIPYFAYSPGLLDWLAFGLLAALSIAMLKYLLNKRKNAKFKVIDKALEDLKKLEESLGQDSNFKDILFSGSILSRRAVSHLETLDISTCSESELNSLQDSSEPSLKSVLGAIIEIEKSKYKPGLAMDDTARLLSALSSTLFEYKAAKAIKN